MLQGALVEEQKKATREKELAAGALTDEQILEVKHIFTEACWFLKWIFHIFQYLFVVFKRMDWVGERYTLFSRWRWQRHLGERGIASVLWWQEWETVWQAGRRLRWYHTHDYGVLWMISNAVQVTLILRNSSNTFIKCLCPGVRKLYVVCSVIYIEVSSALGLMASSGLFIGLSSHGRHRKAFGVASLGKRVDYQGQRQINRWRRPIIDLIYE